MPATFLTVCRRSFLISAAAGLLGARAAAQEADSADDDEAGDVFPLLNCPVCDVELGGQDVVIRQENRELRTCDEECREELLGNYYSFLKLIDEQIVLEQSDCYPLETCLVCGKSLEGKDPLEVVFRNRLFRVCRDDCRYEIEPEPAKYFAKLNAAVVEKQRADYPLRTCIVSKQPLGEKAVDHVCANLLVRLADAGQINRFNERPGKFLEELRELREKESDG